MMAIRRLVSYSVFRIPEHAIHGRPIRSRRDSDAQFLTETAAHIASYTFGYVILTDNFGNTKTYVAGVAASQSPEVWIVKDI